VLKRIDRKILSDGRLRTVNVLPQRLVPRPDETSLWDVIERYWHEPWGDKALTAADTLTEYELSILDGTLTTDQKMAMRLALLEAEQEAAETQAILAGQMPSRSSEELRAEVLRLINEGKTNEEIRALVSDVTLPLLITLRKKGAAS